MDSFDDAHDGHSTYNNHVDDGFDSHHHHVIHHMDNALLPVGDDYAGHEAVAGLDDFSGHGVDNSDLIMSYQDPLMHSVNYHMEPFHVAGGADIPGDASSMMHGPVDSYMGAYTVAADGGLMPHVNSVNDLAGVKNGMLVDDSQLNHIIAMGEVQGAHHVDSAHEIRSEAVKDEFLHLNGYTSIPSGYEIHHIVPLSEGGADDVHNMILLRTHEHAAVTAAQRQYYGWGE